MNILPPDYEIEEGEEVMRLRYKGLAAVFVKNHPADHDIVRFLKDLKEHQRRLTSEETNGTDSLPPEVPT